MEGTEHISLSAADLHVLNGRTSVENADYDTAATEFGEAVNICESALQRLYASQASALSSAEKFEACLKVSQISTRAFPSDAVLWYWMGNALFKLKQRQEAKKAFKKAASLETVRNTKMNYLDWASRCDEQPQGDEVEDMEILDATAQAARTMPLSDGTKTNAEPVSQDANSSASEAVPKPPVDNTRMQWYQSSTHVNIDIFAKDVDKEKSTVTFTPSHLALRLNRLKGSDYVLDKDLFEDIVVDESTWTASRVKVEVRMKKVKASSTWRALDKNAEVLSAALQAGEESRKRNKLQEARQKEWKSVTEEELKDYKEDDSPMSLFRTLYKDGDENMQRAMMKSYTESGGKVLSTNWDDVKKKKVTYEGDD